MWRAVARAICEDKLPSWKAIEKAGYVPIEQKESVLAAYLCSFSASRCILLGLRLASFTSAATAGRNRISHNLSVQHQT